MTYFDKIHWSDFILFVTIVFVFILWYRWRRPLNYPPGPTPLPIIGNLHHLDGTNIMESFRKLRRQYGDVYSLSLGKFWIVVVNGSENLKELLIKKGDVTSDRPDMYVMKIEPLTVDLLAGIILDLFLAGTDTTAATIKWAILFLMWNPDMQEKMWTEIDDVVGNGRYPSMEDKPNLPYSEAVMLESLRLGNIFPFALPHSVTEDIHYKGFVIPKHAVIIPNLDSVCHNDTLFPNSNQFKPERFLGDNGEIVGQEKILTFSLGKRVCLGESLARLELFLYLTALVQRFRFLPADGDSPPPIEGELGVTYSPLPYRMRAVQRL